MAAREHSAEKYDCQCSHTAQIARAALDSQRPSLRRCLHLPCAAIHRDGLLPSRIILRYQSNVPLLPVLAPKLVSLLQEASAGDENARKSFANLHSSNPEQVIQAAYDEAVLRRPGGNHVACVFEELQQAALGRPGSAEAVQGVRSSPTGGRRERGEDQSHGIEILRACELGHASPCRICTACNTAFDKVPLVLLTGQSLQIA